jgi:hypothetical protein
MTVQKPINEERKTDEQKFFEDMRKKIEMQIQDIHQINIMTGVSSDLTGNVNPEAQNLLSFIQTETDKSTKGKILLSSSKLSDLTKPIETPDIVKTSQDLNATILLRTIIELDGDICLLFRGQQLDNRGRQVVSLDNGILSAHQANVTIAVENWRYLVDAALQALKFIQDYIKI